MTTTAKCSVLNDVNLTTILFAILVKKLGGDITITQDDVNDISYNRLMEHVHGDGTIQFVLETRSLVS